MNRFTQQDIAAYTTMSWDDIYAEERAAYEELDNSGTKSFTEEEQTKLDYNWQQFLTEWREKQRKNKEELQKEWGEDELEENSEFEKVAINSFDIQLPDTVDGLNKSAEQDVFYYMPAKLRELVIHHKFIMEVLSYYVPLYMVEPSMNEYFTLDYVIEEAKSNGLFYRKLYCVKGNYMVIFFNFSDRTDEVMVKDYKKNKSLMSHDEIEEIEKKIEEMKAAESESDSEEGDEMEADGIMVDNDVNESVKISETLIDIDTSDVNSYIYSNMVVALICTIKVDTLLPYMKGKTLLLIRHEKFAEVGCKFHNIYFLPTC